MVAGRPQRLGCVGAAVRAAAYCCQRHYGGQANLYSPFLAPPVAGIAGVLRDQPVGIAWTTTAELSGAVRVLCRFYGVSRAVAAAGYWAGAGRATPGCAVSALEVDGDCLRPGYLPERIRPAVSWAGADCRGRSVSAVGAGGGAAVRGPGAADLAIGAIDGRATGACLSVGQCIAAAICIGDRPTGLYAVCDTDAAPDP